jgi:hypothetical protein
MRLTSRELLSIADIHIEALKSARRRDQIAIGFGGHDIVAAKMYLPVDVVALMISSALSKTFGAGLASALTRASADMVLIAVAQAGVSNATVPLAIIDLVRSDGRRAYVASTAAVEPSAPEGYVVERAMSLNVSRIIDQVRARAARADLDLGAPFLPEPGSEALDAMMRPFVDTNLMGSVIEAKSLRRRDMLARKAGEVARRVAMSGVSHGTRDRVTGVTETAATI